MNAVGLGIKNLPVRAITVLLFLIWVVFAVEAFRNPTGDFEFFYRAAKFIRNGDNPYFVDGIRTGYFWEFK